LAAGPLNDKHILRTLISLLPLVLVGCQCLNKGFDGPAFGPKMAEENKREFSEEQLRAGRQGHIGLQAGSNKGATQSGINIGKPRSVHD